MAEADRDTAASAWAWFGEQYPDLPPRLIFVRGVTPERVIESFGANPADARLLTADAAHETVDSPWIRAGRTDDWAFAIDTSYQDVTEHIAPELSAGTELAFFEYNAKGMEFFYYFEDGTEVTSFEGLMAHYRYGTDPDRFLTQIRQAGLETDPPTDDEDYDSMDDIPDIVLCLLTLLTLALGIRLSADVGLGPLLTVHLPEQ